MDLIVTIPENYAEGENFEENRSPERQLAFITRQRDRIGESAVIERQLESDNVQI